MATEPGQILLIGADGMLGRAWTRLLENERTTFATPGRAELDLVSGDLSSAVAGFGTVVNCAAWTDVDGAESQEAEATELNGRAVGRLADACKQAGATLIHYSTDYVFNGSENRPYPIDADRRPVNAYGRSKAEGEKRIEASGCRHLTIRTSWLYAPWGQNFVRSMVKLCRERDELRVVDDQRGRPTSAEALAEGSLTLLRAGAEGFVHLTDGGECTWFGFAQEINRLAAGGRCRVMPCTSDAFPRPAERPSYSVMDLGPAEGVLGPIPDWKERLAGVIGRLEDL